MTTVSLRLITARTIIAEKSILQWASKDETKPGDTMHLAKILGVVRSGIWKEGQLPDGTPSRSMVLNGGFMFQAEHKAKGVEVGDRIEAASIILPGPFAELFMAELGAIRKKNPGFDPMIVVDLSVTATGKIIAYQYNVKSEMARAVDPFAALIDAAARHGIKGLPAPVQTMSMDDMKEMSGLLELAPETIALEGAQTIDEALEAESKADKPAPKGRASK